MSHQDLADLQNGTDYPRFGSSALPRARRASGIDAITASSNGTSGIKTDADAS